MILVGPLQLKAFYDSGFSIYHTALPESRWAGIWEGTQLVQLTQATQRNNLNRMMLCLAIKPGGRRGDI